MCANETFIKNKIREVIIETALKEDKLISASGENKGLFDMPELAFVFEVGKQVAYRNEFIFNTNYFDWYTEYTFDKAGGPSDLIFEYWENEKKDIVKKIILEFKLVNRIETYLDDIEKLHRIRDKNVIKLFCGLKDCFEKDMHEKIVNENNKEITYFWGEQKIKGLNREEDSNRKINVSLIDEEFSFKTGSILGFKQKLHCLISLWEVS